jgi:hypothetical protein
MLVVVGAGAAEATEGPEGPAENTPVGGGPGGREMGRAMILGAVGTAGRAMTAGGGATVGRGMPSAGGGACGRTMLVDGGGVGDGQLKRHATK